MDLTKEQCWELRETLENRLKHVPDGKRLHLPGGRALIETALFDIYVPIINEHNDENIDKVNSILNGVKVPVWCGDFLSKLDLSEVSFDNVLLSTGPMWQIIDDYLRGGENGRYYLFDAIGHIMDFCVSLHLEKILERNVIEFMKETGHIYPCGIKFANTNISIDFSKVFRYKNFPIMIRDCDFSGVDLRNSNISCVGLIEYSSFDNSNLEGISLSFNSLKASDFTGSGVNIIYNNRDFGGRLPEENLLLEGCYIDGNFIRPVTREEEQTDLFSNFLTDISSAKLVSVEEGRGGRH